MRPSFRCRPLTSKPWEGFYLTACPAVRMFIPPQHHRELLGFSWLLWAKPDLLYCTSGLRNACHPRVPLQICSNGLTRSALTSRKPLTAEPSCRGRGQCWSPATPSCQLWPSQCRLSPVSRGNSLPKDKGRKGRGAELLLHSPKQHSGSTSPLL